MPPDSCACAEQERKYVADRVPVQLLNVGIQIDKGYEVRAGLGEMIALAGRPALSSPVGAPTLVFQLGELGDLHLREGEVGCLPAVVTFHRAVNRSQLGNDVSRLVAVGPLQCTGQLIPGDERRILRVRAIK